MAAQEGGEERTAVALSWKEIHPHLRHLLQVETGAAATTSKRQVGRYAPLQAFHTPTPPLPSVSPGGQSGMGCAGTALTCGCTETLCTFPTCFIAPTWPFPPSPDKGSLCHFRREKDGAYYSQPLLRFLDTCAKQEVFWHHKLLPGSSRGAWPRQPFHGQGGVLGSCSFPESRTRHLPYMWQVLQWH